MVTQLQAQLMDTMANVCDDEWIPLAATNDDDKQQPSW